MISPVNRCFARFVMFDDIGMMISASCVKNAIFNTGISAKLTNLGCHRYESFPFIKKTYMFYIYPLAMMYTRLMLLYIAMFAKQKGSHLTGILKEV